MLLICVFARETVDTECYVLVRYHWPSAENASLRCHRRLAQGREVMSIAEQLPISRSAWIVPIIPRTPLSCAFAFWHFKLGDSRTWTAVQAHLILFCTFYHALKVEKRTISAACKKFLLAFFATLNVKISFDFKDKSCETYGDPFFQVEVLATDVNILDWNRR